MMRNFNLADIWSIQLGGKRENEREKELKKGRNENKSSDNAQKQNKNNIITPISFIDVCTRALSRIHNTAGRTELIIIEPTGVCRNFSIEWEATTEGKKRKSTTKFPIST